MAVKQEYGIGLAHEIEQAAVGSVNLVKGLTRLTGLTDLARSGETAIARQVTVKQVYDIELAHGVEQSAIGFVNLVKGLTRLTGLTAAAVLYPSAGFADTSPARGGFSCPYLHSSSVTTSASPTPPLIVAE